MSSVVFRMNAGDTADRMAVNMEKFAHFTRHWPGFVLIAMVATLPCNVVLARDAALWSQNGALTKQAQQVMSAMRQAESRGLSARDFDSSLASLQSLSASEDLRAFDETMTTATSLLVRQLHDGRVDPRSAGYELKRRRASFDLPSTLRQIATAPDAFEALDVLEPRSSQYRVLKHMLARYRSMRSDPSSLPDPPHGKVKSGDAYAGTAKLRELLRELGDAPTADQASTVESLYDAALATAVARFQRRHGLTVDGILGPKTFAALTVPLSRRLRQIELTMERWRWLPDITPPAVIVNVPQFMLYTLPEPGDPADASTPSKIPVIVGESARQTPIFDSAIESVVFRPYWNVPASILRDELLPLIVDDPEYLVRHDIEIVRGGGDDAAVLPADAAAIAALRSGRARLRQRPGPTNALGLIKFMLPNPYSVYLHSTPEAQLFSRERRALSHGCIRVSDASALAAYLLKDTEGGWDVSTIEAATCGSETFAVRLSKPVPIYILYGTVVVDPDGALLFFDDVYGYDQKLEELMRRAN